MRLYSQSYSSAFKLIERFRNFVSRINLEIRDKQVMDKLQNGGNV